MKRTVICAVLILGVLAGCGDSANDLCDRIDRTGFRSAEAISSVMTADGVVPSHETVEFRGEEFSYHYTDVVEVGEWSCRNNGVTALDGRFRGDLSEENGSLVLTHSGNRYLEQ